MTAVSTLRDDLTFIVSVSLRIDTGGLSVIHGTCM